MLITDGLVAEALAAFAVDPSYAIMIARTANDSRECVWCSARFSPYNKQIYCSHECRYKATLAARRGEPGHQRLPSPSPSPKPNDLPKPSGVTS